MMLNSNQFADRLREPKPEATESSVVQMLKVTLYSERNKNLVCFYKLSMACMWAFLQKPNRKIQRDKNPAFCGDERQLCFSPSSVDNKCFY